jgi:ankyrin repeat protein
MALSYHQFPIAHLLISCEAEGSRKSPATHLNLAILEGDADAVDFLLDVPLAEARQLVASSSSSSHSAMLDAVLTCKSSDEIRLRIITTLRRAGLATDAAPLATTVQISDSIRTLISQPPSDFVLGQTRHVFDAVSSGRANVLEQWLGCGADVASCLTSEGGSLLHACVTKDAQVMLEMILADRSCNANFINSKSASGMTALHVASKLNRSSCISLLLRHSADVNMAADASCDGNTSLLLAAAHSCNESVTALLASGADAFAANRLGLNVLHVAAAAANAFALQSAISLFSSSETLRSQMQMLITATSVYGDTPLHLCVLTSGALPFKALKCSLLLLQVPSSTPNCRHFICLVAHSFQAGSSPKIRNSDGKSCIELAEEIGRKELVHLLRRSVVGPLESTYKVAVLNMAKAAISSGDVEVISQIVKEEPNVVSNDCLPDMEGDTCLHLAASLPFLDITTLLLHHQPTNPNAIGSRGRRPLHFAASAGHVTNLRLLLEARADIDAAAADGSTALILACAKGHASVAEALVAAGCCTGIFDSSGLAAVHHAARACNIECMSVLAASANTLDSRRDPPLYARICLLCYRGNSDPHSAFPLPFSDITH